MAKNNMNVKIFKIKLNNETKQRNFRFDFYAAAILDDEYGNANEIIASAESKSYSATSKIVYAGLKHGDDELTYKKVAQNLNFDIEMIEKVFELVTDFLPDIVEKNEEDVEEGKQNIVKN